MNKLHNSRRRLINLYNPKEEGVGNYDIHYMNAYKKEKLSKKAIKNRRNHENERYVA
tara:strand:- start:302 stop:472 length:171 start_codon:yes stop_codon:yes gene_type:complete